MPNLAKNQIIALVGFFIILFSIPISFYLVRQTQIFRSRASEVKTTTPTTTVTKPQPVPNTSPLTDLQKMMQGISDSSPSATPTPTTEVSLAFGPTLNLVISIEGRPATKQADKVFVGLALGSAQTSPTYILTFTIDVPDSGSFKGLSLAGLNPGSNYTAYVKGSSQIDTASTFTMNSTESNLNDSSPLILISGDLNEDNTINATDYAICRTLYGTTSKSSNWNSRADFNQDGVINNYDLAIITKNMGKTGASGTWISTPKTSTPSASLLTKPNVGGPASDFSSVLSSSTVSATQTPIQSELTENPPTHSPYWILVP